MSLPLKPPIRGSHKWVEIAETILMALAASACLKCRPTNTPVKDEDPNTCDHTKARFLIHGPLSKR